MVTLSFTFFVIGVFVSLKHVWLHVLQTSLLTFSSIPINEYQCEYVCVKIHGCVLGCFYVSRIFTFIYFYHYKILNYLDYFECKAKELIILFILIFKIRIQEKIMERTLSINSRRPSMKAVALYLRF